MLFLLLIGFLAYQVGAVAFDKGRKRWPFWLGTIAAWYGSQFVAGLVAGMVAPGWTARQGEDGWGLIGLGLFVSFVAYGLFYWFAYSLPDKAATADDLISQIGGPE